METGIVIQSLGMTEKWDNLRICDACRRPSVRSIPNEVSCGTILDTDDIQIIQ